MAKSVFIKCDNCDVEFKIYVTWLNRPRTSNCCSIKANPGIKSNLAFKIKYYDIYSRHRKAD